MFEAHKIHSVIASRIGPACKAYEQQALNGEIEYELVPQGTLAERIGEKTLNGTAERSRRVSLPHR